MRLHSPASKPLYTLVLLVLATTPALAVEPAPTLRLKPLPLELVVTREGKAVDIKCPEQSNAAICQAVVKGVSGWSFVPGRRDSAATDMPVRLVLQIDAIPGEGGYQLKSRQAVIQLPGSAKESSEAWMEARRKAKPVYPSDELRRGTSAIVTLELWLQPDSNLPRIGQTWLNHGSPGQRNRFVDAATAAASKWPLDYLAPEQKSICMNIEFSLGSPTDRHDAETKPCEPSYIDGFSPPKLLTDALGATF